MAFLKEHNNMLTPHTELEQEPICLTIPEEYYGNRLDTSLSAIIPELSRSKLTNWIKEGFVLVGNQIPKPKDKVFGGEIVTITPPLSDETKAFMPEDIPLNIIFEDEHILIINKQAGLTVHPGNGNWSGTLLNSLLFHYPHLFQIPRAGIVHRLDKDTSGLMVVAKTLLAQTKLVQQLQDHSVSRIYHAIAEGVLPLDGTIKTNIGRDPKNRIKMTTLKFGGKESITHYKVIEYFDKLSYIECRLETGRTHQIRVHLKSLGHPLVGDKTYGSGKINYPTHVLEAIESLNRQALHAVNLSFTHPATGENVTFSCPIAPEIKHLLNTLKNPEDNFDDDDIDEDYGEWEVLYVK